MLPVASFFCTYLVAYVYSNAWHVIYGCQNPQETMGFETTFVHMDRGMHDRWVVFSTLQACFQLIFSVLEFALQLGSILMINEARRYMQDIFRKHMESTCVSHGCHTYI